MFVPSRGKWFKPRKRIWLSSPDDFSRHNRSAAMHIFWHKLKTVSDIRSRNAIQSISKQHTARLNTCLPIPIPNCTLSLIPIWFHSVKKQRNFFHIFYLQFKKRKKTKKQWRKIPKFKPNRKAHYDRSVGGFLTPTKRKLFTLNVTTIHCMHAWPLKQKEMERERKRHWSIGLILRKFPVLWTLWKIGDIHNDGLSGHASSRRNYGLHRLTNTLRECKTQTHLNIHKCNHIDFTC